MMALVNLVVTFPFDLDGNEDSTILFIIYDFYSSAILAPFSIIASMRIYFLSDIAYSIN